MKQSFANKNILITGGSSGIGFALARQLTALGAKVWILGRNPARLRSAMQQIDPAAERIFAADVTKLDELQNVRDAFLAGAVPLDMLINCAGEVQPGEFENQEVEVFHWMMDINYFGTVNVIKTFLPLMKSGAWIINISSMAAIIGAYGYTAYGAAKFAVRGLSDALRSELKLKGIGVSIVYPPDTQTPQLEYDNLHKPKITKELTSTAGIMTAEKVAEAIIKGVKNGSYVIIPGFESNLLYFASNVLGRAAYPVVDWMVSSAVQKVKRQESKPG